MSPTVIFLWASTWCGPRGSVAVCGGRPTFKYTRIEILGTLERLAAGETIEAIRQGYEGRVSSEAIQEALQIVKHQFLQALPALPLAA